MFYGMVWYMVTCKVGRFLKKSSFSNSLSRFLKECQKVQKRRKRRRDRDESIKYFMKEKEDPFLRVKKSWAP